MTPDIVGFYDMLYGTGGVDFLGLTFWQFSAASGMVWCGNPSYTVTDFLQYYPKFFGPATSISNLSFDVNSPLVTGFTTISGLQPGQLIVHPSFPKDTLILSIDSNANTVTMSQNSTVAEVNTSIVFYTAPLIPLIVVLNFVALATSCVMAQRYGIPMWNQMMAWFIAHYSTLWMRTESGPNATASQVASSGLTKGILVHRAAGDVSATSQLVQGYMEWGAWNETEYGIQFITVARGTNAGPIFV